MASMNVKILEEFLFHNTLQQSRRTKWSVRVGVVLFEWCDVCCQIVNCAPNVNRNTQSKIAFVLPSVYSTIILKWIKRCRLGYFKAVVCRLWASEVQKGSGIS